MKKMKKIKFMKSQKYILCVRAQTIKLASDFTTNRVLKVKMLWMD
jgi:hypothetical protein